MKNCESILLKCPSDIHKEFFDYAFRFFNENECKGLLKGSVCENTAHKFSDIDMIIKGMDKDTARKFIYGYGEPALISRTERPAGIIIVIYSNGLCLDLDFREKITEDEIEKADVVGKGFDREDIAKDLCRHENILDIEDSDEWVKIQRLFHRSLIKWIGDKKESGYGILREIYGFMQDKAVDLPA